MGNVSVITKGYSHYPDVSDETCEKIKVLIEADKPKFEPIKTCCFDVSVSRGTVLVKADTAATEHTGCAMTQDGIKNFILALQKAHAHAEANKAL